MPINNKCAYNGCEHVSRKNPELSFHRFPNDEEILRKWIPLVGRDEWLQLEPQKLKDKRICSAHFSQTDFDIFDRNFGKRKLKSNALPVTHKSSNDSVLDSLVQNSKIETTEPPMIGSTSVIETPEISSFETMIVNPEMPPQIPRRQQIFMKKIATLRARLKKARQTIRNLKRRSVKPMSIPQLISVASKYLHGNRLLLFKMQLRHIKTSAWSEDEKEFALGLFDASPKAYEFLRNKYISLPSGALIRRWVNETKSNTVISTEVLE